MNSNGRVARLLIPVLIALAGCSGSVAERPPSAVVELRHGRRQNIGRYSFDDPAAIDELRRWVQECWKPPPPRNRIGSVLPAAAILIGGETFVVYGDLDADRHNILTPPGDLDRLVALVRKSGTPYEGSLRSGEYAEEIWDPAGKVGILGRHSTVEDAPEKVRTAVLGVFAKLHYEVRKDDWTGNTRCDLLASLPTADGVRFARIRLDRTDHGGCALGVIVRTNSVDRDTAESDDRATQDFWERIERALFEG
jgi:hypothetical protein